MTAEEIRANQAQFDCDRCEHVIREGALWAVNTRALSIYHRLCGRTTVDLGLAGWLFQALTATWSTSDVVDVVDRIERIRAVLDPPKTTPPTS